MYIRNELQATLINIEFCALPSMVRISFSMDLFNIISIILCLATLVFSQDFSVINYGAIGDSESDDSQAFAKTWEAACGSILKNPTFIIPYGKTFLLNPITFEGPCKSNNVVVQIMGNIVAPRKSAPSWGQEPNSWIIFSSVEGLKVTGEGNLDAKGADWWNSCPSMSGCLRPTTLRFQNCSLLDVSGLTSIDSGRNHISIDNCQYGTFSSITLIAPDESPNTDGIDISNSNNIEIMNSNITTGDDCIAINSGSSYINITKLSCGPGHGISVGSLGENGEKAEVEEIHVKNCSFYGTTNGARIKTWQGGSGYARKISFEEIQVFDSSNPIIIDQYYCPKKSCTQSTAAVQISDVTFQGFRGTSNKADVINLSCSQTVSCTNILVENVDLRSTEAGKAAYSSCINAHGWSSQSAPPVDCLLP